MLGIEPMPLPPSVFAVDESRLRYGRFEPTGAGFELVSYHSVDLDPDLFATGPVGGSSGVSPEKTGLRAS